MLKERRIKYVNVARSQSAYIGCNSTRDVVTSAGSKVQEILPETKAASPTVRVLLSSCKPLLSMAEPCGPAAPPIQTHREDWISGPGDDHARLVGRV